MRDNDFKPVRSVYFGINNLLCQGDCIFCLH